MLRFTQNNQHHTTVSIRKDLVQTIEHTNTYDTRAVTNNKTVWYKEITTEEDISCPIYTVTTTPNVHWTQDTYTAIVPPNLAEQFEFWDTSVDYVL